MGVVILKFCLPLGECVMAPCRGDSPAVMLELDRGGELQTGGDTEFCRDRGGDAAPKLDVFGGELNRAHLDWMVPPERRVIGTDGSLSVGEELQRLLDESLRGRRVSSRSLSVRM